ncbi:MAG: histidine--tRNA ligase [bacterium]|nr:histidine--tRNA ligase [bacterium]
MRFKALSGFRDFFPDDLAVRRWIESAWHRSARSAGFQEIDGPVLESLELFTAKSGDEIAGQLYTFEDKGGRPVALRPEMTPTLARMVAARAGGLPKPIKWYCAPDFFRYEKPQRGRSRAFQQWNIDVVGSSEPAADAEVISVAVDALRILGLQDDDFGVRINDRRFLSRMLGSLEIGPDEEADVLAIIDKLERDPKAEGRLQDKLGESRARELLRWCESFPLDRAEELLPVLEACRDFGIGDCMQPDFRIVRGLAYYTGPVWEIFDRNRSLRAVAGGGRYDGLIKSLGGPDLPALGFGMGDVVLTELLREKGLIPETPPRLDVYVIPIGVDMLGPARQVVRQLRARGIASESPYVARNPGKVLRQADATGARRAVLVGPDEWADGKVVVKDLSSGDEQRLRVDEIV